MNTSEQDTRYPLNAAELRQEFDRAFAVAEVSHATDFDDFLSIRLGTRPFALRLKDLARIEALGKVVALPEAHPWLLGLTSCVGKLVPVYSVELALGFERSGSEKWLALVDNGEPLGFAFDSLDDYLRIPNSEVYSTGDGQTERGQEQQTIKTETELRPVIRLHSLIFVTHAELGSRLIS